MHTVLESAPPVASAPADPTALTGPTAPAGPAGRRWPAPMAVAAAATAAVVAVAAHDPFHPGAWPECPFRALTGWYCPFCGSTRAVYALLHGQLGLMAADNPLVPLWALLAVAGWLWWLARLGLLPASRPGASRPGASRLGASHRGTTRPVTTRAAWTFGVALAVAVTGFWVLRNLPGLAALAPHGHP